MTPTYPALFETEFKRPTLLPATLKFAWQMPPTSAKPAAAAEGGVLGPSVPQAAAAARTQAGLSFAVLTDDELAKEVLTGRLAVGKV